MKVVVLAPHMDDEVLGCGGLIQLYDDVKVVFASTIIDDRRFVDGEWVEYDGGERRAEMEKVAKLLGFEPVVLGGVTHRLERTPQADLITAFEQQVAGAELVLVPGPSNDHDHVAVRDAARALMRPHFGMFSMLEYWTWGVPDPFAPVVLLPLSDDAVARKLRALDCYETQLRPGGVTAGRRYPYSKENVLAYAHCAGVLAGSDFAEAFTPVRLVPNRATARLLGG